MDDRQFQEINAKLDTIIKLLALNALGVIQTKKLKDQVRLLSSFGFQPSQIAEILGKTPNLSRVTLYELRKSKTKTEVANESKSTEKV